MIDQLIKNINSYTRARPKKRKRKKTILSFFPALRLHLQIFISPKNMKISRFDFCLEIYSFTKKASLVFCNENVESKSNCQFCDFIKICKTCFKKNAIKGKQILINFWKFIKLKSKKICFTTFSGVLSGMANFVFQLWIPHQIS